MTNGVTTKVDWGSRPDGAEDKYRKGMERYAYLKDPKYSHKLEQFFLMVRQGFSGKFVNSFFEKDNLHPASSFYTKKRLYPKNLCP